MTKPKPTRQEVLATFIGSDPTTITKHESLAALAAWYLQPGNFYSFCVEVLHRDLVHQPHEEMASVAEHLIETFKNYRNGFIPGPEDKIHYLCLSPRGTYKSTVWNQCLSIYLALIDPNIRILIDSETVTKAEVFLGDIRDQIEGNATFIALYGNLKNPDKWNQSMASLNSRTRTGLREATFMTGGVGKAMPGMHYDLIIGDDYVSDQNTGTFEQIEKVINHIRRAKSLLDPGAPHFMLGTRWHFNDPYQYILDNLGSSHHFYIRSCGGTHDEQKPLYFPSRLTKEFLNTLLKEQGSYVFTCQYRNYPLPDGEQTFNTEQYNLISLVDFKKLLVEQPYRWYYLVDPAITEESKRRGDYTAISPYVVFPDGRRFLYRAICGKWGADKLIDKIYDHYIKIKLDLGPSYNNQAHIETIAFQKLLLPLLKDKTLQKQERISWKELKTENKTSKEVRIRSAVPYLEAGDLWLVQRSHKKTALGTHDLTDANAILMQQAQQFPMSTNDDMIDNQGYMVHLVKKPPPEAAPNKKQGWDYQMGVEDTTPMRDKLRKMYENEDYQPSDENLGLDKDGKWDWDCI